MPRRASLVLALVAGCAQASGNDDPPDPARIKYHMRQRFNDVRTIERMLVAGKLEEARALAFMLSRPLTSVPPRSELRDMVLAAGALANARTIEEALRADVRVATACARCHTAMQKLPVFRTPTSAPPDRPTLAAQMARHRWAADRMWEGLVGASDEHWRAGLYVMATARLPDGANRMFAQRLQKLARAALDNPATTLDGRAVQYGELLVTCAECHAESDRTTRAARR